MAIEKTKLFERTRERWPLTIRVTPADGLPCFEAEPSLVEVYRTVEASCEPAGEWTREDEWTKLANWSFHQALWELAERSDSGRHIQREEVAFEMFDEWMRSNLSDDCWSAERHEYNESPSRLH